MLTYAYVCYVCAGTQVQDGEGKMVVIAVGEATYQESLLAEKPKGEGEEGGEGFP
jgi:hypothetical protein